MGRTAKYKKIKACDPFSKQNGGKLNLETVGIWGYSDNGAKQKKRSRTAEKLRQQKINRRLKRMKDSNSNAKFRNSFMGDGGIDRPPSDNEDEFDLEDIQGSLKAQNNDTSIPLEATQRSLPLIKSSANSKDKVQETIDKKEIKEATQLLKNDVSGTNTETALKFEGRRENESKRAYNRRVTAETRQIIKQTKMKELNPEKRKRKKEFLNQKKKRKRSTASNEDDFSQHAVDEVPFGHQVERPPIFKSLPRGASSSSSRKADSKKTMKTDKDVQAEQANLEKMRQRVQEQYAMIKAKRKRAGDFHL